MEISWRKIGANRKSIQLTTKELHRLKHHKRTANGVSKEKHGGKNDALGGIRQGKVFSGVACRDVLCIVFRRLEKKKLVIIIRLSYNEET